MEKFLTYGGQRRRKEKPLATTTVTIAAVTPRTKQ